MVSEITVYIIESGGRSGATKGLDSTSKRVGQFKGGALCQGELSEGLETRIGSTFWVRCLVSTP